MARPRPNVPARQWDCRFRNSLVCCSLALAITTILSIRPAQASPQGGFEANWIDIGTYIDWPETLTEQPSLQPVDEWNREAVTAHQVAFEDELAVAEPVVPPNLLPANALSSPRPSLERWHILPEGLLYHSYLAGEKEPRFASQWLWERDRGQVWDASLGGRFGLIRKGTPGPNGQGFQFDVEGAALLRIDPQMVSDPLEAADFRAGFVGTWRRGRWRWKTGYSHVSSHLGDEFLLNNPGFVRRNYVRDSILFGAIYDVTPEFQVYGEIAGAVIVASGGAEPIELQFGVQYRPYCPTGLHGAPFAAINGHLRQEFNFGGSVNVEAGWAWRSTSSTLLRAGFQHYNGPALQWSFFDQYESLTGLALWYDF